MNYKEKGLKELEQQMRKQGVNEHDIKVTLAFNDAVVDNLKAYIDNLNDITVAKDSLDVMSKLMLYTMIDIEYILGKGDTNK